MHSLSRWYIFVNERVQVLFRNLTTQTVFSTEDLAVPREEEALFQASLSSMHGTRSYSTRRAVHTSNELMATGITTTTDATGSQSWFLFPIRRHAFRRKPFGLRPLIGMLPENLSAYRNRRDPIIG